MAFRFDKPRGWVFKAGQFLDMTLLNPAETDAEGNTRSFSIASGPDEDTLMVATRMRDTAFKRVLKTMPIGTAVKIEGPSIDQAMLSRHLSNTVSPLYYIAGPPEMVKGLHAMLTKQSVKDDDIHAEEFSGY